MNARPSLNRLRLIATMALVFAMAMISFWVREVLNDRGNEMARPLDANEPDYIVDGFHFVQLAENGAMRYRIAGEKLTHYVNDTAEIILPVMYATPEKSAPFTIRSETAVIDNPQRRIHMHRSVQLDRPRSGNTGQMHAESEYILILPDDDVVKTDKLVSVQVGASRLQGKGMLLNNSTRELTLSSRVKATLHPARGSATEQ
jgi:lipopolysaccharide export system protein LptC